jgi:hypothetical protein
LNSSKTLDGLFRCCACSYLISGKTKMVLVSKR